MPSGRLVIIKIVIFIIKKNYYYFYYKLFFCNYIFTSFEVIQSHRTLTRKILSVNHANDINVELPF